MIQATERAAAREKLLPSLLASQATPVVALLRPKALLPEALPVTETLVALNKDLANRASKKDLTSKMLARLPQDVDKKEPKWARRVPTQKAKVAQLVREKLQLNKIKRHISSRKVARLVKEPNNNPPLELLVKDLTNSPPLELLDRVKDLARRSKAKPSREPHISNLKARRLKQRVLNKAKAPRHLKLKPRRIRTQHPAINSLPIDKLRHLIQ